MTDKGKPYFSVAIPTYEMSGKGVEFLDFSFKKLYEQSFKDFEIILSDHSKEDGIRKLCEDWSAKLDIKYFKNEYKRGSSSANINNSIKQSSGKWIKLLFQDDFLYAADSLEKLFTHIENNKDIQWIATGCEHTKNGRTMYWPFYPSWAADIHLGNNTISSPSVISIKNTPDKLYFDEGLIWLMDVEYYKRMHTKYGEPSYIHDILVVNRIWKKSVTNTVSEKLKQDELHLIENRYNPMLNK
jgi:glycosyltransferase involved in cell wall biosynthesis